MKPRLLDVLDTLIVAVSNAINAAEIPQDSGLAPGQTVAGWAVTTELTKILALGKMNHLVVLWPLKPKVGPIYNPNDPSCQITTPPTVLLTAAASIVGDANVLTFGGSIPAVYNVHVVINGLYDILVQTTVSQGVAALAAAVEAAINGESIPGVSATVNGDAVSMVGAGEIEFNIGGTGSITREVYRLTRPIRVITYAPNPMARTAIDDAITQGLGTVDTQYFALSDGQGLWVTNLGGNEQYVEKAQSSYSAFEAHQYFEVEYPITTTAPATQIGATKLTKTIGSLPSSTSYGSS